MAEIELGIKQPGEGLLAEAAVDFGIGLDEFRERLTGLPALHGVALHPEGSWLIGTLFNELLADLDIKGIGGMTLGADPLISATTVISHEKGRPLAGLIVRKESKGHGTNQYVEGLSNFKPGDPVAMVEDVVTTGGSLLKACERVKDAGLNVVAVCTVLDRGEGGREAIEAAGYQLRALFTRPELVELAKED